MGGQPLEHSPSHPRSSSSRSEVPFKSPEMPRLQSHNLAESKVELLKQYVSNNNPEMKLILEQCPVRECKFGDALERGRIGGKVVSTTDGKAEQRICLILNSDRLEKPDEGGIAALLVDTVYLVSRLKAQVEFRRSGKDATWVRDNFEAVDKRAKTLAGSILHETVLPNIGNSAKLRSAVEHEFQKLKSYQPNVIAKSQ